MDETGQSGGTGPDESGSGTDPRDRARVNGWANPDSPWSNAGSALDPSDAEDVPAWRRPSQEIRPFARQPLPPDHQSRPFGDRSQSSEIRPFGSPPNPFEDRADEPHPFLNRPAEQSRAQDQSRAQEQNRAQDRGVQEGGGDGFPGGTLLIALALTGWLPRHVRRRRTGPEAR